MSENVCISSALLKLLKMVVFYDRWTPSHSRLILLEPPTMEIISGVNNAEHNINQSTYKMADEILESVEPFEYIYSDMNEERETYAFDIPESRTDEERQQSVECAADLQATFADYGASVLSSKSTLSSQISFRSKKFLCKY